MNQANQRDSCGDVENYLEREVKRRVEGQGGQVENLLLGKVVKAEEKYGHKDAETEHQKRPNLREYQQPVGHRIKEVVFHAVVVRLYLRPHIALEGSNPHHQYVKQPKRNHHVVDDTGSSVIEANLYSPLMKAQILGVELSGVNDLSEHIGLAFILDENHVEFLKKQNVGGLLVFDELFVGEVELLPVDLFREGGKVISRKLVLGKDQYLFVVILRVLQEELIRKGAFVVSHFKGTVDEAILSVDD